MYNKENDTKNAAFLAGINRGEINNCILQNCTVEIIRDDSDFGNLTNWNEGIIINCHVDNVRLKMRFHKETPSHDITRVGKSSTAQSPTAISVKLKTEAVSSAVSLKTEKFWTAILKETQVRIMPSACKQKTQIYAAVITLMETPENRWVTTM